MSSILKKLRLTRYERRCANEFAGDCPDRPWDHLYEVLPFELMEMAERGDPRRPMSWATAWTRAWVG